MPTTPSERSQRSFLKQDSPAFSTGLGSWLSSICREPGHRKLWSFFLGLGLLLLAGYLSWRQPTPGQNDPQTSFFQDPLKGFFYPIEVNPQFRPPTYPASWFFYPWAVRPGQRPIASFPNLYAIAVVPGTGGRTLVAVGGLGTILHTTDGGATWNPRYGGKTALYGVTFTDGQRGWAVGRQGTILHTIDGGVTWRPQDSGRLADVMAVAFADAQRGRAVGSWGPNGSEEILGTSDGGETWGSQDLGPGTLHGVTFVDARTGWAVGFPGGPGDSTQAIFHTTDSGASWSPQRSEGLGVGGGLIGVAFADARTGWAVGIHGPSVDSPQAILHTSDGGMTWSPQSTRDQGTLYGVTFSDAQTGWAVGCERISGLTTQTILHTTDGGEFWGSQRTGVPGELYGVAFSDARTGWALGKDGNILHTTDGGANWSQQEGFRYRKYPAPWFYASVALAFLLIYWSLLPVTQKTSTIEDIVTADAPVESLERDRLGKRSLVERLSGLLINPNTQAPLVITLQAPWGMGKSSVMRMMQSHLERKYRATTVWFNAWHHQKEDQLLAYLMETVQKEAVPQWLSLRGPVFRMKLIARRLFGKDRLDRLAVVICGIAVFYVSAFQRAWLQAVIGDHGWLHNPWITYSVPLLALLPSLNVLIAFKSNPDKLTGKSGGFLVDTFKELVRLPSLVGKSDVRQEFENNLKDVVAALKPHRLVIFLDDLDRCRPEQVIQILEAINFLSSVANCFLIVGADYKRVETLVANEFENIALREKENETAGLEAADGLQCRVKERTKFARNYMKKIVNLRIDLAKPTSYERLLTDEPETEIGMIEDKNESAWKRLWRRPRLIAGSFAAAVLLVGGIWWWGRLDTRKHSENPVAGVSQRVPNAQAINPATGQNPNAEGTPNQAPQGSPAAGAAPVPTGNGAEAGLPMQPDGGTARNVADFGIPALIAMLALIGWYNRSPATVESTDAPSFIEALTKFSSEISQDCGSPREARRFLNYLRLIGNSAELRNKYGGTFDRDLVGLASTHNLDDTNVNAEVKRYYVDQCTFFGLDPKTFKPKHDGGNGI